VDQFLGYLKGRGMTVEPISWELRNGTLALQNLLVMLSEAAAACHVSCKRANRWDYLCFWLDERYWFGVRLEAAEQVFFMTGRTRVDPEANKKLGFGYMWEARWVPGGRAWQDHLDLASEEVHFFARSLASQKECLEQFLARCLAAAKKIEIPGPAGALPAEPEDSA
jgi:hypothetical protein